MIACEGLAIGPGDGEDKAREEFCVVTCNPGQSQFLLEFLLKVDAGKLEVLFFYVPRVVHGVDRGGNLEIFSCMCLFRLGLLDVTQTIPPTSRRPDICANQSYRQRGPPTRRTSDPYQRRLSAELPSPL